MPLSPTGPRTGTPALRRRTALAVLLLLALLLCLLPPLLLSQYARPSADDYSFGYYTHWAVRQGEGMLRAIRRTVWADYRTWQGSFSAMALMTLTPCIFSEQAYWLTTMVMLASVLLGTFALLRTLVMDWAGGRWQDWVGLAATMALVSLQFLPSPCDSFYWWNGSIYYTFTYGMALLYLERFVSLLLQEKGRWTVLVPGCLLGVFVGGSNYVSGLLCLMVGVVFFLFSLRRHRSPVWAGMLLACLLLPFLLNMAAPGNQVRQAGLSSLPAPLAILAAVAWGALDAAIWPNWSNLLLCLAWIPLLYRLAGKLKLSFRLPGVFLVFSFLFFAAQNTPHFYAATSPGPLRLRNIVYLSYYWLLLLNEAYWLGWFRRRIAPKLRQLQLPRQAVRRGWYGGLALLTALCIWHYAPVTFTGQAVQALADGSAAGFAQERDSRLIALLDPEQTDPRFAPLQNRPVLLFHGDISDDPTVWTNQALANFYQKSSVALTAP